MDLELGIFSFGLVVLELEIYVPGATQFLVRAALG